MGAALTYARRYALFTLVGIAGEDDLDAPDLENRQRDDAVVRAGAMMPLCGFHSRNALTHKNTVLSLGVPQFRAKIRASFKNCIRL
jgi:hypothetical protein